MAPWVLSMVVAVWMELNSWKMYRLVIYLGRKVGGWLMIRRWLKTWWRRLRRGTLSTSAKGALSVEARPVKGKVGSHWFALQRI